MEDDVRIGNAISLFEQSRTGRGERGDALLARMVAIHLRLRFREDEIAFEVMEKSKRGRSWGKGRLGYDVIVNERYRRNLPVISLTLVHEGVHLAISRPYVDEELRCRTVQIEYYKELIVGIQYHPSPDKTTFEQLDPGLPSGDYYKEMEKYHSRDQLVDFVLDIGEGKTYAYSLTANWVRRNIRNWGGITNRWATSKGHFIRALAMESYNEDLIMEILESIEYPKGEDWREVMDRAGGPDYVLEALHRSPSAYIYKDRLRTLKTKWGDTFRAAW